MAIIDSLLNVLRTWRTSRAEDRSRVVTYLRKIADSSLQFRDSLVQVERGEEVNVWVLEEKATLIGQYYKNLSSVFEGKINSELLAQLADYLERIYIADNRPLVYLRDELHRSARNAAKDRETYTILIPPNWSDEERIYIEGAPTFVDCLQELSTLAAQINGLADAIDAGGEYR